MTSRYRVEYALKTHRRDGLIEWIKGLLAVPFVLHSRPEIYLDLSEHESPIVATAEARRRYAEIFADLENLVNAHCKQCKGGNIQKSRLKQLVPTVGAIFTELPLTEAFYIQDRKRAISARRLVSPSFNDIRLILNTAQAISSTRRTPNGKPLLRLVTFDGDVTLYDDGSSLTDSNPVIPRLISLLDRGLVVGIVTAAGYADKSGERYATRLRGLLDALHTSTLAPEKKKNLILMGGEANFMFSYDSDTNSLSWIEPSVWELPEMKKWHQEDIDHLLDSSETILKTCKKMLDLPAEIIRKERAVGLVPLDGQKLNREQLEEVVLATQKHLDYYMKDREITFSAFNGGSDVWVDVGDKRFGVMCLQEYFKDITAQQTIHVGDQFTAVGANDYKARMAGCTAWVANPAETVKFLDELNEYMS